jgi:hypothetical protein
MFAKHEKNSFKNSNNNHIKKNEPQAPFCWFHNEHGHSPQNCYSLLTKTGQEVTRLAKEKGICLICSKEQHEECPNKERFACLIPGGTFKHALIFCFKRKRKRFVDLRKDKYPTRNDTSRTQKPTAPELPQSSMNTQEERSRGLNVIPSGELENSSMANLMLNALHSEESFSNGSQNFTIVEKSTRNEISASNHNVNRNASLSIVCV